MTSERGVQAGLSISDAVMTLSWRDNDSSAWKFVSVSAALSDESGLMTTLSGVLTTVPPISACQVTLLRPLAHLRTLSLPAMARDTAERVLARDWGRYVVGVGQTPHAVVAERADRGRWRAAFAPAEVLEAIARVAEEQGWQSIDVRAADDALAGAVRVLAPAEAGAPELIVVVCDSTGPTDAVHLRSGAPWVGRRFVVGATDDDVLAFARNGTLRDTSVVIMGGGKRATVLARRLGAEGVRVRTVDTGLPADASSEATFAVLGTLAPPLLPLRARGAQAVVARRSRHITRWLVTATAAALLAAFAMERWRVHAELVNIAAQRAEISAKVRTAVALRAEVDNAIDIALALAEREARASRVGGVLAAVTLALPDDASLTSLHVAGDSVTIEGESSQSAGVYEALRGLTVLEQVKLAAPLRQVRQASGSHVAVEHFAFSARVRGASSSAAGARRVGAPQ